MVWQSINADYQAIVDRANDLAKALSDITGTTVDYDSPPIVTNLNRQGYLQLEQATALVQAAVNGVIKLANDNGFVDTENGEETSLLKLEQQIDLALGTPSVVAISDNIINCENTLNKLSGIFDDMGFITAKPAKSDVKAVFAPLATPIIKKLNSDNFNVGFFTDPHWQRSTLGYKNGPLSWSHIDNIGMFDGACDVIISAGDNNNSYDPPLGTLNRELVDYSNKFFAIGTHSDKYMLLGNHDDGSLRNELINRSLAPGDIINEDTFKTVFRTGKLLNSEVRDGDSLWFYKDYDDKQIRMIGLNSEDIDDSLANSAGSIKYDRQHVFAIRQRQFDFLINALLTAPAGYQVLIVAHVQADPTTVHYSDADEIHHNYQILIDLIDAFVFGGSIDESGIDTDFEVHVQADFSSRGPGILIGYWNGHTHTQKFVTTGKAKWMDVHCPNSVAGQSWHVVGQPSEDAFDILSVDTTARHVTIYGFGAASDREYDY